MTNRLLKVPRTTFRAGVPAQPPSPAYCTYEPLFSDYGAYAASLRRAAQLANLLNGAPVGALYYGAIGVDSQGQLITGLQSVSIDDLSSMFFGAGMAGTPRVLGYTQVCYPALAGTPAIPPLTTYDAQTGWNSGGLSIGGFAANGYAQFRPSVATIGCVVGINTGPDTERPSDCSHAFYVNRDGVSVFERGQQVYTVPGAEPGDLLRIDRREGVVNYFVNDAPVYQSLSLSSGYARIDASLYVAGDYVDTPVVGALNSAAASVSVGISAYIDARARAVVSVGVQATARGRAGDEYRLAATTRVGVVSTAAGATLNTASATTDVGVTAVAAAAANVVSVRVPRMSCISASDTYAQVEANYAGGYESTSEGGFPEILFAGVFALTPAPQAVSIGLSGGIGDVAAVAPVSDSISADYPYAQVLVTVPSPYQLLAYEPTIADDAVFMDELLFVTDRLIPFVAVHASFSSVVEVGDDLTIELELLDGFEWLEALIVTASFAELSDKTAEFSDTVYVTDQTMDEKAGVRQVASNTVTAAPTTYTDFEFITLHHLGRFGSFAVREDGIYRVASGGLVSAHVDTGSSMFGGYAPKRLEAIYIGMRTNGQLIAVVRAEDESERTYRVIQRPDYMRVSPAKGDTSKTWRLRLELTDAQEGDVDVIQFVVSEQSRRWSR